MSITETALEIPTADGVSDGVLLRPTGVTRAPGVLHLPDGGGLRPSQLELARRCARAGYIVLVPNVFYRSSRVPVYDFAPNFAEERTLQRFKEITAPLTPDAITRDANSYVDFLRAHTGQPNGKLGVVGHCYTGGVALRYAAARPDAITIAASFHGGRLFTDSPTSPHTVLPQVKAQLYFAHAVEDGSMPAAAITKFEAALAAWGGDYVSETYAGAYHSWTSSDSAVYDVPATERAYSALLSRFAALPHD